MQKMNDRGARTAPICPYRRKCSGCQLQNLTYPEQIRMKQVRLIKLIGRFCHVDEIIGMEDPLHYRNKVQSAYAMKRGQLIGGVYRSSTGSVAEVEDCMIEDETAFAVAATMQKLLRKHGAVAYDSESGKGFVRHALVRRGFKSGEVMAVLVTRSGEFRASRVFTEKLVRRHPEITTVIRNINDARLRLSLGEKNEVLYGKGYIEDSILGLTFRISPAAFYQVNPVQTEVLYSRVRELAGLTGREVVLDAYSGTGTIGMLMADAARKVISVELNRSAVDDALANAEMNGIKNIEIHCADAGEYMKKLARERRRVDVLITDPPRAGCSAEFLKSTLKLLPERIVYVSCNPETLARDLGCLTRNGYRVRKAQGVDMFPYTEHVETVCLLTRKDEKKRGF